MNVTKTMKFTKLVHLTEINVVYAKNLQIFCKINIPVIKIEKLQNYKTGDVIA